MAKTIIVFLALSIFVAHCHVLKEKEPDSNKAAHKRGKRSCYVCESDSHGPPPPPPLGFPPPPPFFRRWHWNSPGGGSDGPNQEVLSAASSSANTDVGNQASGNYGGRSGYGGQSASNSQAQSGVEFGHHPHHSFQSGYNQKFEEYGVSGVGQGFGNAQQIQSGGFNTGRDGQGGFGGSQSSSASSAQAGGGFGQGYEHGQGAAKYQESDSFSGNNEQQGYGKNGAEFGGGGGSAGSGQEALSGALNLASQGLQTAKQTSPSGCSTCDKSNYALSNAKSGSGNAIAVSIGR